MAVKTKTLYLNVKLFLYAHRRAMCLILFIITCIDKILCSIWLRIDYRRFYYATIYSKLSPLELWELLTNMSAFHQKTILYVFAIKFVLTLVCHLILTGCILYFIRTRSTPQNYGIFKNTLGLITLVIKLIIQYCLIFFLVQFSSLVLLIPQILTKLLLSTAPIILVKKQSTVISSLYKGIYLSWQNFLIVLLASLLHCCTKLFIWFSLPFLHHLLPLISINVLAFMSSVLNHLLWMILVIVLYNIYVLYHQQIDESTTKL